MNTTDRPGPPDAWQTPSMWEPLLGYLAILMVLCAPITLLVACLLSLLPPFGSSGIWRTAGIVVIITALNAGVVVLLEQPFIVRRKLHEPGGWGYALLPRLAAWACSAGIVLPVAGLPYGLPILLGFAIVDCALCAFLRPWEPGPPQTEYDEIGAKFHALAQETFADDIAVINRRIPARRTPWRTRPGRERLPSGQGTE